jgi:MerR HTH family regulatory protein
MQIGPVAKKIGLSVDAIRFYERNALLPHAPRSEGGFRQYEEGDIVTLSFIRRAQGLGFTLGEVPCVRVAPVKPPADFPSRFDTGIQQIFRLAEVILRLPPESSAAWRDSRS